MNEIESFENIIDILVKDYGYSREQISTEVSFKPKKGPTLIIDIVVFDSISKTKPLILVEIMDRLQLSTIVSMMERALIISNAEFAFLTDGEKSYTITKTHTNAFLPIVSLPKAGSRPDEFPLKISLRNPRDLDFKLWRIMDYLRGEIEYTYSLSEIQKLLLCKIADEQTTKDRVQFCVTSEELESANQTLVDQFESRISVVIENAKRAFPQIFPQDETFRLSLGQLKRCISEIQDIELLHESRTAVFAYSRFLSKRSSYLGMRGEFHTPISTARFMISLINPSKEDTFLDPFCRAGVLLTTWLEKLIEQAESETDLYSSYSKIYAAEKIADLIMIAKMQMILSGDGSSNIVCEDVLLPNSSISNIAKEIGGFGVIATIPPWGVRLDKESAAFKVISKAGIAKGDLATAIIAKSLDWLKSQGQLAIVLPDGHLFNQTYSELREFISDNMRINGIISLASGLASQQTSLRSNILLLEKIDSRLPEDYDIFMAYLDDKRMISLEKQMDEVLLAYRHFKENKSVKGEGIFIIPRKELGTDRWDVSYHIPLETRIGLSGPKLDEICEIIPGVQFKRESLTDTSKGIPYVRIGDLRDNSISLNRIQYVTSDCAKDKDTLLPNDVVISIAGTIGKIAIADELCRGAVFSRQLVILRPKPRKILPAYLVSVLNSEDMQAYLKKISKGSVISRLSISDLGKIRIPLHSMSEQQEFVERIDKLLTQARDFETKAKEAREKAATLYRRYKE